MRENTVQSHLFWKYRSASGPIVPGYTPAGWWENDLFRLTKAGYWYEYEFKSSFRDFKKDFEKVDNHGRLVELDEKRARTVRFLKHNILGGTEEGNQVFDRDLVPGQLEQAYLRYNHKPSDKLRDVAGATYPHPPGPNRFTFVVPEKIVDKVRENLPEYAGLMVVRLRDEGTSMEKVTSVKELVKAPERHRLKVFDVDELKKQLFETFYWRYWRSR